MSYKSTVSGSPHGRGTTNSANEPDEHGQVDCHFIVSQTLKNISVPAVLLFDVLVV